VIDFGSQHLQLPWTDPRAEILTPYHGQTVLAGIRPDMLVPVQAPTALSRGRLILWSRPSDPVARSHLIQLPTPVGHSKLLRDY
jgi:hypothetical protein